MDDPYLDFCCSQPANLPRVLEKRWKIPVNFPEMYRFPIYIYRQRQKYYRKDPYTYELVLSQGNAYLIANRNLLGGDLCFRNI